MTERNEQFLERTLPSSYEAEDTILGTIILEPDFYEVAAQRLEAEDFYSPYNRKVWEGMVACHSESRPIHPIAIAEVWKTMGYDPDNVGGVARITNLTFGVPMMDVRQFKDIVKTVKDHSIGRQTMLACNGIVSDILAGFEPVTEIVQRMETKVLRLSSELHTEDKKGDKPFESLIEIVPSMRQQFHDYHAGISNGIPSGMEQLDEMLDGGGFQGGGLYVLAAQEKTGKTSLALDWVSDISIVRQLGWSLIITGEMSKISMGKRLYSPYAQVPYWKFRPGIYDSPDDPTYTKALAGLDKFGKGKVMISDRLVTVPQITRHLRRRVEAGHKNPEQKVVLAVIDYLQLMELGENVGQTEKVEKVSRAFKLLAMELDIPIIAISSMNRIGAQENAVPDTFNLRQAGTIGFDAEAIMFLHNPNYVPGTLYVPQDVTPMNLILSRQRNGPSGTIPVMFIGPYMQFMTVKDYDRLRGPRDNDNVIPQTKEAEAQAQEDLNSLWE